MILADVILSARLAVGDGPTDNLARNESLDNNDIGNFIDGTSTLFSVVNFPIVPGGMQTVQKDGVTLVPATYTVLEPIGEIQFSVAPIGKATVTYYYYLMNDATWTTFISIAISKLNRSTGVIAFDLTSLQQGLQPALQAYACGLWAMRISSQTGLWYNQKLQERAEDRENISRKFMVLAQEFNKQGDSARDEFYGGAGTQHKPSFRIIEMSPRPYTPMK